MSRPRDNDRSDLPEHEANDASDDVRFVHACEIRRQFNNGPLPEMITQGRLQQEYLRNAHLTKESAAFANEPFCTHAQTIRYVDDNGVWQVEVFQYKRADGTIGASGKPDPKRLRMGDVILVVDGQVPRE